MAGKKRLIVGLGNPGIEYEDTRHNVGFLIVDALARQLDVAFESDKGPSLTGSGRFRSRPVQLVKPLTYMNRSGTSVLRQMNKWRIAREDMLVVYDDLNLDLGVLRIRKSGSAGGHNGVQDIIDVIKSNDFPRLRVGIGSNFNRGQQSKYVLSPFLPEESETVEETIQKAKDAALLFVTEGLTVAMNQFNKKKRQP